MGKYPKIVTVVLTLALIAGACGDDDEVATTPATEPSTTATTTAQPTTTQATTTTTAPTTTTQPKPDVVKIGIGPFFEYQPWVIAHELGLDAEQRLEFDILTFDGGPAGVAALANGTIDTNLSGNNQALVFGEEVPEIRLWMMTNLFKGFIVVGRRGETITYDELIAAGNSPADAKQQVLESFRGKSFAIQASVYSGVVGSAIDDAGLTLDDIEIIDFANDAQAAFAFIGGTGDFYTGSLPEEATLILEHPDDFVAVGGEELGFFKIYSGMATTDTFVAENYDTLLRMLAVWYRTMKILRERPDIAIPIFTRAINEAGGSDFSEDEVQFIISELEEYNTLEEAQELIFNPDSDRYWKVPEDEFLASQIASGELPEDYDASVHYVLDDVFNDLLARADLIAYINGPVEL